MLHFNCVFWHADCLGKGHYVNIIPCPYFVAASQAKFIFISLFCLQSSCRKKNNEEQGKYS